MIIRYRSHYDTLALLRAATLRKIHVNFIDIKKSLFYLRELLHTNLINDNPISCI